ncbi:hypothetical protein FHW19_004521 [Ochrobactrum anthropi]|uniref:hypothetical protein n=1 Tax=Brucella anthropi TaxID=529 RepID=UPI0015FB2EEB|nr:hypothetical protein [Brucella anthropi]MBA8862770.1 hypothetical protein [Brucella anthropi]
MTKSSDGYDEIVRAEVAIEIMNRAQGLVTARLMNGDEHAPDYVERLHEFGDRLVAIRNSITVEDQEHVETIIAKWGTLVKDQDKFWQEL